MNRISTLAAVVLLSQAAFSQEGRANYAAHSDTLNQNPLLTGASLANASIELKTGKKIPLFASLSMIVDSPLSEHPVVRFRLMDWETGKEKFLIVSLESDSDKQSEGLVFVDRSDPKRKSVIGKAFDQRTFLDAFGSKPELFFQDQTLSEYITKQGILLRGYKQEDLGILYDKPIKLSLMPSNTQDNTKATTPELDPNNIKEIVSFTYEMPPLNDSVGYDSLDVKYAVSMSKLLSEIVGMYSRVVTTEQLPDSENPRVVTELHRVDSDVSAVITFFGEDIETNAKSYHILLERRCDLKPVSSTHLIEEKDGTLTVVSYDAAKGQRFDRKLGQLKKPLDFQRLSSSYNGTGDPLAKVEKELMQVIMKPFSSTLHIDPNNRTSILSAGNENIISESFLPIHQQAIVFAQKRANQDATLMQVIAEILKGLELPWRINQSTHQIFFYNPDKPRKLKE